ncbi:hypothetical protein BCR36DRAFT_354816 [Piromyces finnis]|uniref:Protein kinase domain-containing protein n=1 Tax=Piromyces finnis TaxID=1754191 RepID=A0A1Y1V7K8_9FUNG|nr:hypothetical protein BCR36DRAFT_354816 [Piromyces finnis]|eukprot:ORX48447.1 hypothetical protein BCR36DRAFT_354816 [Piromyces finnis]
MRIGGHLNSYLRYGYLRRLLHPLEQEREFIFYTDQLCSIAQFFGFYLIEGQQRLREDEEDQLIDFAEFTQVLESVQGNDAKLLSFLGLDVDPTAFPDVLHALENAIQMNGVSSNKIVTIDLKNEHLLSNTRILTFISNQLSQINRHLISTGQSQGPSQGLSQGQTLTNPYEEMSDSYSKLSYDYVKPITPVLSGPNSNDLINSQDEKFVRKSGGNKSKNLTDFLGLNEPDNFINKKSRSRSRSRSRNKKASRSQSRSRNRSRNRSNQLDPNDDSEFIYETDLQYQERQMRQAITDVYNNKLNTQDNIGNKLPSSPVVRGRSRMIKDTINAQNQPLRINTNIKSNKSPFLKSGTTPTTATSLNFRQDNEEIKPVNLNILDYVDSEDSDEFDYSQHQHLINSNLNFHSSQGLNSKVGYTQSSPLYAPQEIYASKLENNCLIIDTQLQLKYVYYELLRIGGNEVSSYIKQAWKIPFWDLEFWDMIESTLISKIYRGIWHFTEVAVKEIDITLDTPELQQQFKNYVENWYSLRHPHIIPLLGASQTHNVPYVVMPYLSKGNLVQYLENDLDIPHLLSIILDISSGMQYLHSRKLIHGELMASNILIDNYGEPSICDLGFSKYFYFTAPTPTNSSATFTSVPTTPVSSVGNESPLELSDEVTKRSNNSYINRKINRYIRWTANEIQDNYVCTFASDVYSFGMLCYEIFSGGDIPFSDIPEKIIPEAVKSGKRPNRPPYCPDEIWELMQECWHVNPDRRPSFYEISQRLMQIKTHYKIVYSNADMILPKSTLLSSSPEESFYAKNYNKSNSMSWMNSPAPSLTFNHPNDLYPKSPLIPNNQNQNQNHNDREDRSNNSLLFSSKHASIDSGFSMNSINALPSNIANINMNAYDSESVTGHGKVAGINMNINDSSSIGSGNFNPMPYHDNVKPQRVGSVNSQKISPYMKAALMNSYMVPNGNYNTDESPISGINLNKLGPTTPLNYLQQLRNDEENSNINKFNESRVTNIPLSPSTTTDSDEVYESLNRNEMNGISIVDKSIHNGYSPNSSINNRYTRRSPSLKIPSPNMKSFSPSMKQQRNSNIYPSPKLSSSLNANIIKIIPTSSSTNPILSHRPPTMTLRQNSHDSYQSLSENDNVSGSPLLYYNNNSPAHARKRNSALQNEIQFPNIKNSEVKDVDQYISKHLIMTKDNGIIDIDLNNDQFIQQIENLDMTDNFLAKRNSETQQSREYIEKVLKKVSSIRKEYEVSFSEGNENEDIAAEERHNVQIVSINDIIPSENTAKSEVLPVQYPPMQPLPTQPPPPPPPIMQDVVPNNNIYNDQVQYYNKMVNEKIKVVSPQMIQQRKPYNDGGLDELSRISSKRSMVVSKSPSSIDILPLPQNADANENITTMPTISTVLSKSDSINERSDKKATPSSSSVQIQALSQLTKQLKRASFQLLMESENEESILKYYNEKEEEESNSEEKTSHKPINEINRSKSFESDFKPKNKERIVKSNSTNLSRKGQGDEIRGILRKSTKSNALTTSHSESNAVSEENNGISEEFNTVESSSSKKNGIVGILKTTNNTIRNDTESHRDIGVKSNMTMVDKNKNMLDSVCEKHHTNNTTSAATNTVRFALDDDISSRESMDEFDLKGMTADSMDQIANMLVNEEGEIKFDTKQQIMFHKKKLEECINELRYRIGDNQVKECIREETIEINTYSWSDLSFKRTSIRILIDIIKHTFAKNVILKDCRFSDLAAKCIAMAVKKNPYIKRLDITFCSKWARTQTDPITNILNYDSARYDSAWVLSKLVGPKAASAFANMLQVNTTLKVLQLRNASFGDTGVALIAKALQTNHVLERLEINNCCTAEYGSHALAESLKINKSLQTLNLSQNPLSDRGGIAIVNALQENSTLKALILHRCTLSSSKFCDSLSKTLKVNQSLVEIDMGSNSFSKDGIKFIADGLSHNSTLSILKLEDCNLSKKCVNILSKALDNEQNKTELHLGSVLKFWDKKEVFNKRILFHKEQFA